MEFDDWELSAEELDFLERDAIRRIEERSSSSYGATCSPSKFSPNPHPTEKVRDCLHSLNSEDSAFIARLELLLLFRGTLFVGFFLCFFLVYESG